jgi:hypothetical protein
MKKLSLALLSLLSLVGFTCGDSGPHPPPPPEATDTSPAQVDGVQVPDVIGVDLVKARVRLEQRGFEVDLSALPKTVRGYATGFQTHPRVQVTRMDPLPGTTVQQGATIVILDAECPPRKDDVC